MTLFFFPESPATKLKAVKWKEKFHEFYSEKVITCVIAPQHTQVIFTNEKIYELNSEK